MVYKQTTAEYMEVNVGDKTGVDSARELTSELVYSTIDLKRRIVVLDECQQMTTQAQNMLLKPIEDATEDTHFILCTTEPKKIIKPLRSRCKPVEFKKVSKPDLLSLLEFICQFEGLDYNVRNLRLILVDTPSPRDAVSSLQQIVTANKLDDPNWIRKFMDQLTEEEEGEIIELARLVNKGYWKPVSLKLKQIIDNYSEEQIRVILALYFTKALFNAKNDEQATKLSTILSWLKQPIYTHKPLIELTHILYGATKRK
jgi:DNA polymerase III gamma/tau subunit